VSLSFTFKKRFLGIENTKISKSMCVIFREFKFRIYLWKMKGEKSGSGREKGKRKKEKGKVA
jgi:hypothetical protein